MWAESINHTAAGRGAIELSPPSGAGKLELDACRIWFWSRDTAIVGAVALVARTGSIEISGYVTAAAVRIPRRASRTR